MHLDCCFAYQSFFVSFPHTTVENLQNCLSWASSGPKSAGFALWGTESTRFLFWETGPIRTPALGTSNHQDCFLDGPKSAAVLPWRFRIAGWRFNPNKYNLEANRQMRLPGGWSGTAFIFAYCAHSFRIRFAYPDAVLCPLDHPM